MLGMLVGVLVCIYIYFAFSTTSLIAQHRSFDRELDELIAERSHIEYEYHIKSEQLFAMSAATYNLNSPVYLTYISLSEGMNVAFVHDTQ